MLPACKTAKAKNGKTLRVGSTVLTPHGIEAKIVEMYRQGYDGTIIRLDKNPDPDFHYHWTIAAREVDGK